MRQKNNFSVVQYTAKLTKHSQGNVRFLQLVVPLRGRFIFSDEKIFKIKPYDFFPFRLFLWFNPHAVFT